MKFHFNKSVDKIVVEDKKAKGLMVDDKFLKFDRIISNVDVNLTYKELLNDKTYLPDKENMSSSAIIFLGN